LAADANPAIKTAEITLKIIFRMPFSSALRAPLFAPAVCGGFSFAGVRG
jgi:hypothetical protein